MVLHFPTKIFAPSLRSLRDRCPSVHSTDLINIHHLLTSRRAPTPQVRDLRQGDRRPRHRPCMTMWCFQRPSALLQAMPMPAVPADRTRPLIPGCHRFRAAAHAPSLPPTFVITLSSSIHTPTAHASTAQATYQLLFIRVAIRLFYKLCIDGWDRLLLSILCYAPNS